MRPFISVDHGSPPRCATCVPELRAHRPIAARRPQVMKSRRLMQNMGFPPLLRRLVYRTLSLPQASQQVLGLGIVLNPAVDGSPEFSATLRRRESQAHMQHARPRVHVGERFNLLGDRQKRDVGLFEVQRLPTAHLLPIVARNGNSAFPLRGQLWIRYVTRRGGEKNKKRWDRMSL
jgi:hypothetical protein